MIKLKGKNLLYIILIIVIGLFLISFYFNQQDDKSENIILEKNVTTYNFEPNWWLKPQTYGMFNYNYPTDYTRLKITNCTINGYRLVFDLSKSDYKSDIEEAHNKGIKYVAGMLFKTTKSETGNGIDPASICLPYENIRNNALQKAKKIIDLGADGLAVVHPFGDHLFMNEGLSCLCLENIGTNLNRNYQLSCAIKFYQEFAKEVKDYAESKGKDNFPIAIASHGESLIPLTIDMLPFSDFAFINLELEESYQSQGEYKLHYSATKASVIVSPVDASFGWLIEKSRKPEDLMQIKMAEAYANKGAFQDQDKAGLSTKCAEQEFYDKGCWLKQSVNPNAVRRINSFYLSNKELFDINLQSTAKIAILFSAKSVKDKFSEHWSLFNIISRNLSKSHFQYDVIFSEDSDFSPNTLNSEKLQKYKLIFLPNNNVMDDNAISLIPGYLKTGGKIIIINQLDPKLSSLKDSFPFQVEYLNDWDSNRIDRIVENIFSEKVGIQLWKDSNKVILHLVNYNFDLNKGVIEEDNIPISINMSLDKAPNSIKVISPDFEQKVNLDFNYSEGNIQFTVPKLKVWDVLLIE